jgi:hypothetical protein
MAKVMPSTKAEPLIIQEVRERNEWDHLYFKYLPALQAGRYLKLV